MKIGLRIICRALGFVFEHLRHMDYVWVHSGFEDLKSRLTDSHAGQNTGFVISTARVDPPTSTMYKPSRCQREWGALRSAGWERTRLVRSGAPCPTFGRGAHFGGNVVVVGQSNSTTHTRRWTGCQTTSVVSLPKNRVRITTTFLYDYFTVPVVPMDDPRRISSSAKGLATQRLGNAWPSVVPETRMDGPK